jgi:hypothetical protein
MSNSPITEALRTLPIQPSNTAGAGITGSQADGIAVGVYVSKDLGKGNSIEASAGLSSKAGGYFSAFWRKVWK